MNQFNLVISIQLGVRPIQNYWSHLWIRFPCDAFQSLDIKGHFHNKMKSLRMVENPLRKAETDHAIVARTHCNGKCHFTDHLHQMPSLFSRWLWLSLDRVQPTTLHSLYSPKFPSELPRIGGNDFDPPPGLDFPLLCFLWPSRPLFHFVAVHIYMTFEHDGWLTYFSFTI